MVQYDPLQYLPTAEELPDSDDTPVDGVYVRQAGEPVWMAEIELGIGRGQGTYEGCMREWLYWYDQEGKKYPSPEEVRQQAEQRAEQLAAQLRALGLEPDAGLK